MSKKLKATIVAAIIALVAAVAVNYGLISQQTADEIKAKTNEALTEGEASQPSPDAASAPSTDSASQASSTSSGETTQDSERTQAPSEQPTDTGTPTNTGEPAKSNSAN